MSEKLNNWKLMLQTIQTVVDSTEERQMDGNSAFDLWLADLRDVAYDMEDLLDHFDVEAKRSAFKAQTQSAKLPSCLIACCSKIDPRTLLQDHRMANEIEEVDRRLEEVLRQKEILQFDENFRSSLPANSGQPRFSTTSLSAPKFVGRKKHMEELLDRLTRIQETQDSVRPFTVLSIIGMGGLGKTALAQQLYNHKSVSNAFKLKAWACVSAAFDSVAITKSVLQAIDPSSSCEGKDLNWLQTSLKQQLSEKKFLIVLDDVRTENYNELESLFKPFYSGSSGSRILLTTRNCHVAKMAGDRNPKKLDLLSTNDCLSLLAYHAIGKDSFNSLPHLEDVAVKLAEKCKGLPLAVKSIGGLLRFESNDEQWQQVLDNGIWMGEGGQEKIPPALKLSYVYLPIHLKRCFAACALFPKDDVFEVDELIQMWLGQGLLHKGTAKTYRDVGLNYLGQLVDRSLLQKVGDKETQYSMHDLINNLAKSVVGVTYFRSDEYTEPSIEETLANVRRAAMVSVNDESIFAIHAKEELEMHLRGVLNARKSAEQNHLGGRTKLDGYTLMGEKDEDGQPLNEQDIIDLVHMYLFAGFDSITSATMTSLLYIHENFANPREFDPSRWDKKGRNFHVSRSREQVLSQERSSQATNFHLLAPFSPQL